ncbi:hypothetical protein L1049_026453 [Liquidambar formosana]|uniref:VPS9 domain-containing protein n=1 Tax=Liquidambar formosana TaxID=63359 RepID=A0AAP0R5G9_LIQFO
MENSDVLGSSTAPLTLHDFFERMRQPSAADFVKAIKSFVVSFSNNAPNPEKDSAAVQEFLANMEAAFRVHPLWAGCSEEDLESAGEGLEKYVMTKLFTRVFASLPDDVKLDDQLFEKMALIQQFIRPENLDIKPNFQNETSWLLAQKELQKINMYKAPRDKLACILNCCKVINNLLYHASIASNENPPGADEFLPVLIYVTLKANPPQLHSNLLYIQRYRRQSRLVAEAAYFFTNMLSAESFISNIDANALSMDETEFEKNMESARALLSSLSADMDGVPNQNDQNIGHAPRAEPLELKQQSLKDSAVRPQSPEIKSGNKDVACAKDQLSMTKIPSISDLENKGATMLMKEDQVSQVFQEYPYLFAHVGDLTINDVDDLLNNYKQLVFKYVCLSKGLAVATPSHPLSISQTQAQSHAETCKRI